MKFIKENLEKVISLSGLIFSIVIIYFALTYEIKTDTHNETIKHTDEKIGLPNLEK